MDYTQKKDKATYLVQRFMGSDYFFECNLNAYEISILYTIARYLDMPEGKCFAHQKILARQSGMCVRQFKISIKKLSAKNLLLVYSSWRNNGYELGEYFESSN
jgi:hypothetical protein